MWGWIVLGVVVLLLVLLLTLRVHIFVTYDDKLFSMVKILFFEREFSLSNMLDAVLFPKEKEEDAKKKKKKTEKAEKKTAKDQEQKEGYLQKLLREEGLSGVLTLLSNVLDTTGALFYSVSRHFNIHRLYVAVAVADINGEASETALEYGRVCARYYPMIGWVRSAMKVRDYRENIYADYLAQGNVYDITFHGSISVGGFLAVLIRAGSTFLVNLWKENNASKKEIGGAKQ